MSKPFRLSSSSKQRLLQVHPDLSRIVHKAIKLTKVDFAVIEGPRSYARQVKLFESGASSTMNSRHLLAVSKHNPEYCKVSHAVDLAAWVDGAIRWDWPLYHEIARAMKAAAEELGLELEWGGDWKSFPDGPHFQLPWASYPVEDPSDVG